MEVIRPPRALAISDGLLAKRSDLGGWLEDLVAAGVPALQIREKRMDDGPLYELLREVRRLAGRRLALLVNGRADLALAAEIDGVHLPASGIDERRVRNLLGDRALIGRSTHHPWEVEAAFERGADYVTFGPVYSTPSKASSGPLPGLDGLRTAVAVGGPVLALGGITMERIAECVGVGAYGIAGIRLFDKPLPLVGLDTPTETSTS